MSSRLRLGALVFAAALVGSPACGVTGSDDDQRVATPAEKPSSTTPTTQATGRPSPGKGTEVRVTDDGSAPRRKLRLKLRRGTRTNLAVKVTTMVAQEVSGRKQTAKVPPITENLSLRIVDVRKGVASFELVITGVTIPSDGSLPPAQLRSIQSSLRRLVGLTSSGKIDDRGGTLSSEVHIPSSVPAELRQTLQQLTDQLGTLSVPLPEEAVGRGARWTARSTAKLSGVNVDLRNDFTLTNVDRSAYTLEVDQRQTAAPQPFVIPTLPLGAKARIIDWDITATGTNTLQLGDLFPEATLRASGRQTFQITLNKRKPQTLKQDLSVETEVTDVGN